MPHQRQIIRHAVRQAIEDAATAAGTRVTATQRVPHRRDELPAISVYTDGEQVADVGDTAPRELTRVMQLVVQGYVEETDLIPADDAMDELALEIEAAMDADRFIGCEAGDSMLASTETDIAVDGDRHIGLLTMTYDVTYRTFAPAVMSDSLDDFETVGATHKLGDVHDGDVADDVFTVEAA